MVSSELLPQEFLSQLSISASALQAQGWSRAVLCRGGTASLRDKGGEFPALWKRSVHGVFSVICNRE